MAPEPKVLGTDANEALTAVKDRAGTALYERMGSRITDASLDEAELQSYVKDELRAIVDEDEIPLTAPERHRLVQEIMDDVLGLGPLQQFLNDTAVTEIMVNGPDNDLRRTRRQAGPHRRPVHLARSTCAGSSSASSPGRPAHRRVLAHWSTPALPTDPASTRSSRRWRSTGRR